MPVRFGHVKIICGQILRTLAFNDGARYLQVLFVMRMNVLGVVCFNVVMPFTGQNDIGRCQNSVQFFVSDDTALLGSKTILTAGKIAPIVHNSDIIGIQIFPGPVQTGQLTEIPVFSEIFSPVSSPVYPISGWMACPICTGRYIGSSGIQYGLCVAIIIFVSKVFPAYGIRPRVHRGVICSAYMPCRHITAIFNKYTAFLPESKLQICKQLAILCKYQESEASSASSCSCSSASFSHLSKSSC